MSPLDATISAGDTELIAAKLEALTDEYRQEAEATILETPLMPAHRRSPKDFEPIHCRAFVSGNLMWRKNGIAEIRLQIPYEYRDKVTQLVEVINYPLEVYVRPCVSKYD